MQTERIEAKWIDCFAEFFALSQIHAGETVAILSETQSRAIHPQLAELALARLGAKAFHVVVPTPRQRHAIPIRSTGASQALQGIGPVVEALRQSDAVIDCTLEGLLHAPELPRILSGSARVLMISNEHPEALERLLPSLGLRDAVNRARAVLESASEMHVTSPAGTDLRIQVAGAPVRGAGGIADRPGQVAYWPAGLIACFPRAGCVNGRLVLDRGDVNLTFKRYLESPVRLAIENDFIVEMKGEGLDFELMRDYFAAWNEREAYATSHVGWGLNPAARWDALTMYDKVDTHGTELRCCAGNFLYSTGSNQYAGRFTAGHFDLPVRGCTIRVDGQLVVESGRVLDPGLAALAGTGR